MVRKIKIKDLIKHYEIERENLIIYLRNCSNNDFINNISLIDDTLNKIKLCNNKINAYKNL
jgi:hypothetical protein